MELPAFKRIPKHVGLIPDGNRRWAQHRGLPKYAGYAAGIKPGFELYRTCIALGIEEISVYGFTNDNTHRPAEQTAAFSKACVSAVKQLARMDAELLVVGNDESPKFPPELKQYRVRQTLGRGLIKVNFLVNYDWQWDLNYALRNNSGDRHKDFRRAIASADVSRIDLLVRWGGRRRLSGFLPVQSVYSDIYVVDELWPDYKTQQFFDALHWYESQDITLGG